MSEEETVLGTPTLPLKSAYTFGVDPGLRAELNAIRNMEIGGSLSNLSSSVRRGFVVSLFEKRGILEEFKATHWAYGNTPEGHKKQDRYLRLKQAARGLF